MPRVEFVGQSARDSDNIAANPSRLLNLYREPVISEGRTRYVLKSVLGQEAKDDIGTVPVRAMGRADDKNWMVAGGTLYEVASDGTTTSTATVADDENSTIAGNYTDVTVVANDAYYLWDGVGISQPTTKAFTNVGSHCYVGGYTVLTETDGRRFQWSALGDASTLDALHFASADKVDDDILRAVEFRGNLLLLCETSTEIWQITGSGATAFSFVTSSNTGLKSFNLLVRFDDALFFVGNDGRAYLFGQGVVSTPPVETAISQGSPTHCFYYEDEGHKFCVIRFSDRPAWVFDISTGEWHERSEGAGHIRWRAQTSIRNGATWLLGNIDGEVLELTRTNQDISGLLYRRAISRTIFLGDRKFSIPRVEIVGRVGVHMLDDATDFGWAVGDGFIWLVESGPDFGWKVDSTPIGERDASIDFYESLDGGQTWRGPTSRSMGRFGDYDQRMVWRARGQAQQYTMRFDMSEPADITLYADAFVAAA